MSSAACPYCAVAREDVWVANDQAFAIPHPQPIARFHMVIAPARHTAAFYDLDVQEQRAIWDIMREIQKRLKGEMDLAGVHVGFEDGQSEQDHSCVHLIPKPLDRVVDLPAEIEWVYIEGDDA